MDRDAAVVGAGGEIGEFTVRGGSLTALEHISLPTGAGGAGVAVN